MKYSGLSIGIDIGGTFTDAVAVSAQGISIAKVPSNPEQPAAAVLAAVDELVLELAPDRFLHGTTLVTNMLLERRGAKSGVITSQGMRDILHIGRHERPLNYAIRQEIPQQHHPPAPRRWRITVPERVSAGGEVITPLDEAAVRQAAQELVAAGVETIAICFLHAYRYPQHEILAEKIVREAAPDLFVCTSHEVSPRFREYERFLTTAWNARVAPRAATYLTGLAQEIDARWPGLKLNMMTSNGGLEEVNMFAAEVKGDLRRTPIRLGLSGPAAAGNAVGEVARKLGLDDCVGLDVGGTSSDIVVIRSGRLGEAPWEERRVGGYPLQIPMLDLHTIGAGGGSLVSWDDYGALHVGPQSAGAVPGPACYGRGGTQPTVTDAAAVAGRLPASLLLGGVMPIQVELARRVYRQAFGNDTADGERMAGAALDVLALAEANIAFGIRERTVARGLDPSQLSLVAAGGAGPLLACGIADILQLAEVIVPPRPGLLAAWGLLVAPERRESAVTVLRPLVEVTAEEAAGYFQAALEGLSEAPPIQADILRTAALRYLGQGFEVEITVSSPPDLTEIAARFHQAHEKEYGFAMPSSPVEWVELRVAWEIPAAPWEFSVEERSEDQSQEEIQIWEYPVGERTGAGGPPVCVDAQLYHRANLPFGQRIDGPCVIVETDATTYIPTGWVGKSTTDGYLRIVKQ